MKAARAGSRGREMDWQYLATGNDTVGQGRNATIGMENANGSGALRYLFDQVGWRTTRSSISISRRSGR